MLRLDLEFFEKHQKFHLNSTFNTFISVHRVVEHKDKSNLVVTRRFEETTRLLVVRYWKWQGHSQWTLQANQSETPSS
jgi:hypothetical protein